MAKKKGYPDIYFLQTTCPCKHFGACAVYQQTPGFSESKEKGHPFHTLGSISNKDWVPLYEILVVTKEHATKEKVIQAVTDMQELCKKCRAEHTDEGEQNSRICISQMYLPTNILLSLIKRKLVVRVQ